MMYIVILFHILPYICSSSWTYFEYISPARSRSTEFRCCQVPKINYLQFYIAVLILDHKSAAKTQGINWETLLTKKIASYEAETFSNTHKLCFHKLYSFMRVYTRVVYLINVFGSNVFGKRPNAQTRALGPGQTRKHCCGNIMFLINVSLFAHLGKHCCGNKICLTSLH